MTNWFASSGGSAGNPGTLASPWDLQTAITSASVQPGDGVFIRAGTYNKTDATWSPTRAGVVGTGADNPDGKIIYRAYNPTLINIYDTGDPSQTERVILQETNTTATPTTGLLTTNTTSAGAFPLQVTKAAGVNQAVSVGHQLVVASGPGAGVYVVTVGTTIVAGSTTAVTVTPNIRGAISAGVSITLLLGNSAVDLLQCNTGTNFVWFWDLELAGVLAQRTFETSGPTGFSTFNQTTDGIKLIHCLVHDLSGGVFIERTSGRHEVYGNIFYNQGYAMPQAAGGDGGGHHIYIHHNNGSAKRLTVEGNVMFSDEGVAMQMYDSLGVSGAEQNIDFLNNVCFNSGSLNSNPSLGGIDAKVFIIGGPQEISSITCQGNYNYQAGGNGDVFFQVGQPGQLVGVNINISNNYSYMAGSGFGAIYMPSTIDGPGGGKLTVQGNTFRIKASDSTHNGYVYQLAEAGTIAKPSGYVWGNNKIIRALGPGGRACGDEVAGGQPFIGFFSGGVNACRTLAQFQSETGLTGDTLQQADPAQTLVVTIPTVRYVSGRGIVLYYNYASLANIPFSPSDFGINPGDTYVVHDVRNIWAGMGGQGGSPVIGPSVYAGGTVNLPNTQVSDPVMSGSQWGIGSETTPPTTAPTFNAFLVRRTAVGLSGNAFPGLFPSKMFKSTYNFAGGSASVFASSKEEADSIAYYRTGFSKLQQGAWDIQPKLTVKHASFGALQSITFAAS